MFIICSIIFFSALGGSYEQTIETTLHHLYADVGGNVQYHCKYSSEDVLWWYKHSAGSAPQYLLSIQLFTGDVVKADSRCFAKLNKDMSRVALEIPSAEVTDSALYYCALGSTVTGNAKKLFKNLSTHVHSVI
ncbi:hypothetical protein DPEC_G00063410 [Dallia pectoralis]|uniref:Uncharacterized protein n=1 Tax=Dallia pectoralis TaxID=75939 RepID=A0ACC2H7S8_DALPE|nr:hypothetical protein DPEC_G00063410 [Dallia pectoralis]